MLPTVRLSEVKREDQVMGLKAMKVAGDLRSTCKKLLENRHKRQRSMVNMQKTMKYIGKSPLLIGFTYLSMGLFNGKLLVGG